MVADKIKEAQVEFYKSIFEHVKSNANEKCDSSTQFCIGIKKMMNHPVIWRNEY